MSISTSTSRRKKAHLSAPVKQRIGAGNCVSKGAAAKALTPATPMRSWPRLSAAVHLVAGLNDQQVPSSKSSLCFRWSCGPFPAQGLAASIARARQWRTRPKNLPSPRLTRHRSFGLRPFWQAVFGFGKTRGECLWVTIVLSRGW